MTEKRSSGAGKFAIGALIGMAAGAIAGILAAPKSGKETRADISRKAGELKDTASDKLADAKDFASDKLDDAKEFTSARVEDTKKFFDKEKKAAIKEAKKTKHDIKRELDEE